MSRKAVHDRLSTKSVAPIKVQPLASTENQPAVNDPNAQKRKSPGEVLETSGTRNKKPKRHNFLQVGARKAKASKAKQLANRVGARRHSGPRLSNTGSQVPMDQVIRLRYVKGFTQAVRTPCRLKDL